MTLNRGMWVTFGAGFRLFPDWTELLVMGVAFTLTLPGAQDAREIMRHSVQKGAADWDVVSTYSYLETDSNQKLDAEGHARQETRKTFEVQLIDGSPYNKLVALDGKPLSADDERKERIKLKNVVAERARESREARAKRIAKFHQDRQADGSLMKEMMDAFDFTLKGEDKLNGHDVYVVEAKPRPGYHPTSQKTKVLMAMRGRLWIEKQGYHWVRAEAEVTQPVTVGLIANVGVGTRFELYQEPAEDGRWLPKRFVEQANVTFLGLKHYRVHMEEIYTDYRRADLEARLRKP
jgi:hypothetical protein